MFLYLMAALLFCAVMAYFVLEYSFLVPAPKGLPVLMYHKLSESVSDGLTVTCAQFDQQLHYLREKGYRPLHFSDLIQLEKRKDPLPPGAIVITFDDAYTNFRDHALPILKKHGFTATLFLPVAFIGKTNIWDRGSEPILGAADLKMMANNDLVEMGLHSFLHRNYRDMAPEDIAEDLKNCRETLNYYGIPYFGVLAYPYGGHPGKDPDMRNPTAMLFEQEGIDYALRIGNRINRWPFRNRYELCRIDVRGTDTFCKFRIKVKKGRTKRFA